MDYNLEPLLPEVVPDRVPEVQLCVARGGSVCQNGVRVRKREPLLALWVKRGPIRLNPNLWVLDEPRPKVRDPTGHRKILILPGGLDLAKHKGELCAVAHLSKANLGVAGGRLSLFRIESGVLWAGGPGADDPAGAGVEDVGCRCVRHRPAVPSSDPPGRFRPFFFLKAKSL